MEIQNEILEQPARRKVNTLAVVSMVTGILSFWIFGLLVPGLADILGNFLFQTQVLLLVTMFSGLLLGLAGLITGILALLKIHERDRVEMGIGMAVSGMVIGMMGLNAHIVCLYLILL